MQALPGVAGVAADAGRAVLGDRAVGSNSAELWVALRASAPYGATLAKIRTLAEGMPGIGAVVSNYEADSSTGILAEHRTPLTVRVYGEDYAVLDAQARRVSAALHGIAGIGAPRITGLPVTQPTLRVAVDLGAAQRHQLKPGDVRRAVTTLVSGLTVGNFFEQQNVFDVVVRGAPGIADTPESVAALPIDTPDGGSVRLGDVAHVRLAPDATDIRHDDNSRYLDVTAPLRGASLGDARAAAGRAIARMRFPLEYHAELPRLGDGGATTPGRFVIYIVLAEIGLLLLLQAALRSWELAFAVLCATALATSGAIATGLIRGDLDSLGALAGVFASGALALRQGTVLIARALELTVAGDGRDPRRAALEAAAERLGPVLRANIAAAAVLAPFAIGDPTGNEITGPLATVAIAGLITTTGVVLLLLPAVHALLGARAANSYAREPLAGPVPAGVRADG
jgi:Cu/Ag efflux pump CusA